MFRHFTFNGSKTSLSKAVKFQGITFTSLFIIEKLTVLSFIFSNMGLELGLVLKAVASGDHVLTERPDFLLCRSTHRGIGSFMMNCKQILFMLVNLAIIFKPYFGQKQVRSKIKV